jgi:hypothetical protein
VILKLLNWQGIAGIAASLALAVLLVAQKSETHHWKKASAGFEQLYRQEQSAFATTVADYRAAAQLARAADRTNAERVAAKQSAINERTEHDLEARLASVRTRAEQLRVQSQAATHPRAGASASMPDLSAAAGGSAQAAGQDRLPAGDALTATEQAIQLDELIKWVQAQAAVDNNPKAVASPIGD